MFSAPGNFSDKIKQHFMDILVNRFHVIGVNIVAQTLLSLYSYNSRSGIVVDVGERLEIVPVTDGGSIDFYGVIFFKAVMCEKRIWFGFQIKRGICALNTLVMYASGKIENLIKHSLSDCIVLHCIYMLYTFIYNIRMRLNRDVYCKVIREM